MRGMSLGRIGLVIAAASAFIAGVARADGLSTLAKSKLGDALACVNLSIDDLGWDKRPVNDPFRLTCVNETLDNPLALPARAERAEREFAADPAVSALAAAAWLDVNAAPPARVVSSEPPVPRARP